MRISESILRQEVKRVLSEMAEGDNTSLAEKNLLATAIRLMSVVVKAVVSDHVELGEFQKSDGPPLIEKFAPVITRVMLKLPKCIDHDITEGILGPIVLDALENAYWTCSVAESYLDFTPGPETVIDIIADRLYYISYTLELSLEALNLPGNMGIIWDDTLKEVLREMGATTI